MTHVAAGILQRAGRILICQRSRRGAHPLQWEFPGGKVEPGETETGALVRELREELAIEATVGELLARLPGAAGSAIELAFYSIASFTGEPRNLVFESIAWAAPAALPGYDFLAADVPVLDLVLRHAHRT
jgi:8-oxo-dGTP diphosphatase